MNQEKIGKFIAECRKQNNMTQEQLAERLNITAKAISKWETGRGMPDSSIMLNLCDELKISVNELLNGEKVTTKSFDKTIIESIYENEKKSKKLYQGSMLLGCSIAFNISTIIFGVSNQMVVVFGGITFGFILAGMITLLKRK